LKRETGAKEQLQSLKNKINDLSNRIEITGKQLDDKSKTLAGQVKHVQTLEFEQNNIKSNYAALKKMEDGFEWYKDGVKAIMKVHSTKPGGENSSTHKKNSKLQNDVICLMADIIDPKPTFASV